MITELVLFDVPRDMTRAQILADMRRSAAYWRGNADLIRKNYLYDAAQCVAGGAYLWKSLEAARHGHDEAWRARIRQTFGSEPTIRYFETPLVLDNALQDIIEEPAA